MTKTIYTLLLVSMLGLFACKGSKIENVCLGVKNVSQCCKSLSQQCKMAASILPAQGEEVNASPTMASTPLPAYTWDTMRVLW